MAWAPGQKFTCDECMWYGICEGVEYDQNGALVNDQSILAKCFAVNKEEVA